MLNDNSFQLNVIDSFAGNSSLRNDYKTVYTNFRKLKKEFNGNIKEKADQNKADLILTVSLVQLDEARLVNGEQGGLKKNRKS